MPLLRKYVLYLLRWQLSTPILAVCVVSFAALGATWAAVLANFIGGLLFFWVDRWIFNKTNILRGEVWEVREHITCADCGAPADRGYRLAKASNYDRTADRRPEFRCHECSRLKYERDNADRAETHDRRRPDCAAGVSLTPKVRTPHGG